MRSILFCALAILGLAADDAKVSSITFRFTKGDVGKVPARWKAAQTGEGKGSQWEVMADKTAPSGTGFVLAQKAEGPTGVFNICIAEKVDFDDVEVTVQFKANAGTIDQGGGVVWRYVDANNYYIARYNPLENNYRVYKVVGGKRMQLATKEKVPLAAGKWYSLSIMHKGKEITCSVDGKKQLEVKDDTFTKPGKVGVWTKADAQTSFDDLVIKAK